MKKTLLLLCMALSSTALAGPEVRQRDDCHNYYPITPADLFLAMFNGTLNAGDNYSDDPTKLPPLGFQLKIDSSSAPPPEGPFVKLPNGWPMKGTDVDKHNRKPIPPAFSRLVGDTDFGVVFRVNDVFLTDINMQFDCDPHAYGGALKEGALTTNLQIKPVDDEDLDEDDELQLRLQFVAFDRQWEVDLIDVDLDNRFLIQVAAVPRVNGDSLQLDLFYDFTELRHQGLIVELLDEIVPVTALAAAAVCGLELGCTLTITAIVSGGLLALEPLLLDEAEWLFHKHVDQELLDPMLSANTVFKDVEVNFKKTVLENVKVNGKTLPDAIDSLPIPNFNGLPQFEPETPGVCQ